jgi:hypothetical protein
VRSTFNIIDRRYFDWYKKDRDIDGSGLITILHPWESGLDLSPAYDPALGVPQRTYIAFIIALTFCNRLACSSDLVSGVLAFSKIGVAVQYSSW